MRSLQDNTSIQDEISRYFLFLKDDFIVLEERIDFLTSFHEMIKKYLLEKDLLKYENTQHSIKQRPLIPQEKSKNEIKNFRKRISQTMSQIDHKKLNLQSARKSIADNNSSLLTNYLRKQRLQEYQTNTKYYLDNPLKANKKNMSPHTDMGLLDVSGNLGSGMMRKLEKIHEDDELEHYEKFNGKEEGI